MRRTKRVAETSTQDAIRHFLASKINLTDKTLTDYREALDRFNLPSTLSMITQEFVNDWLIKNRDSLTVASINHYLTCLRVFLRWCVKQEYTTNKVEIKLIKGQQVAVKYYNDSEIARLIRKPQSDDFITSRNHTIICTLLATGMRASTLINIHLSDVDFDNRIIHCRHTKNHKYLDIPISSKLHKVLKDYIRDWERDTDNDYLFCTNSEQQLTVNGVYQALSDYHDAVGVPYKGIHCYRHTFARVYITNGGSPFYLQQLLGHSDLTMTRRYVTLFASDIGAGLDKLSALDRFADDKSWTIKKR